MKARKLPCYKGEAGGAELLTQCLQGKARVSYAAESLLRVVWQGELSCRVPTGRGKQGELGC